MKKSAKREKKPELPNKEEKKTGGWKKKFLVRIFFFRKKKFLMRIFFFR